MLHPRLVATLALLLVAALLLQTACSSQAAANSGPLKPTWITAAASGNDVSVPVSQVEKYVITHFKVNYGADQLTFMAYKFNNVMYVRADICPPCLSQSFSLKGDTLVCNTCGTVFSAPTGSGVRGACVNYAKAPVTFAVSNGNIVMRNIDLVTAYQNTLNPSKS